MRTFLLLVTILGATQSTLQAQPQITNQPTSQDVWPGGDATFTVGVTDTKPFTYQWQVNSNNPANGIITTVAGNGFMGLFGRAGDGGPATNATMVPWGITVDTNGNLYIVDTHSSRIRKVDRNGISSNVAGNDGIMYYGDGGPAINGSFNSPVGIAVDAAGDLFIADGGNNRIRKVSALGIITTVAGSGTNGFSGDGSAATNAELNSPSGVAVDAAGELFIADNGNNRIRKVDANGIITTVGGNGMRGLPTNGVAATGSPLNSPTDVAVDASGNLFIADLGNHTIDEITNGLILIVAGNGSSGSTGDGGAATNALLTAPNGVAVDNLGNVFIADKSVSRIREVDGNGIITTIAGNSTTAYAGDGGPATNASLITPYDVAVDASGSVYISDRGANDIRKVTNLQSQSASLVVRNVKPTQAGSYQAVVTDTDGSVTSSVAALNVGSITNAPISSVNQAGTTATFTVGVAGLTGLNYQWLKNGVTMNNGGNISGAASASLTLTNVQDVDAGAYSVALTDTMAGTITSAPAFLLVMDSVTSQMVGANGNITLSAGVAGTGPFSFQWQFDGVNLTNGIITTVAGGGANVPGDGGPATNATLNIIYGLTLDNTGNLLIADDLGNRVRKVDDNGIITTIAGNGLPGYSGEGGPATNASLSAESVIMDPIGDLFIGGADHVFKVDTNDIITALAGTGTESGSQASGIPATNAAITAPFGLALDGSGNLLVTSSEMVRSVDTNGIITTVAGMTDGGSFAGDGGPATNAILNHPFGVARDAAGNLYIADNGNNRIRKMDTNGIIWTIIDGGTNFSTGSQTSIMAFITKLYLPSAVTFDTSGNLYVADSGENLVRKMDTNYITTTVAGGGGSFGDGGLATKAILNNPWGLVVDAAGDVFIADQGNNRVRKVMNTQGPILTLNNVSPAGAGNYQLVVAGPGGSVTSSVVPLVVIVPPVFAAQVVKTGGSVAFNLQTTTNVSSRLFAATNLVSPVTWVPVYTNASGGTWQFTDTNAGDFQSRFYRLSTP